VEILGKPLLESRERLFDGDRRLGQDSLVPMRMDVEWHVRVARRVVGVPASARVNSATKCVDTVDSVAEERKICILVGEVAR
jgi:hypothetical protein